MLRALQTRRLFFFHKPCVLYYSTRHSPNLFSEDNIDNLDTQDDFFQLFEMDKKYDIDLSLLEKRYKDAQKKYHPDRYATKSEVSYHYFYVLTQVQARNAKSREPICQTFNSLRDT